MLRQLLLLPAVALVLASPAAAQSFDAAPDTEAPVVRFEVDELTGDPTPVLRWTAEPDASGSYSASCRIDGRAAACVWGEYVPARPLDDGVHTFAVEAIDGAGNRSPWTSVEFTVDTQAPTITQLVHDRAAQRVRFVAAGYAKLECATDGGGLEPCTSPFGVAPGARAVTIRARDEADNATVATLQLIRETPPVASPAPAAPAAVTVVPTAPEHRYAPRPYLAPTGPVAPRRTAKSTARCATAKKAGRAKRVKRGAPCKRPPKRRAPRRAAR